MDKYISIFFLTALASVVVLHIIGSIFPFVTAEDAVFLFGMVCIVLFSFIISQLYYIIDLIKKKR
ncbi:MAG: hypothetical protein ACK4M9_03880 [Anaerobacillus sp.]|uniref:hypothetical protein n=1 Tax=Anaerobacillus sp. TaxID=1872506 RepID=UPI00391C3C00